MSLQKITATQIFDGSKFLPSNTVLIIENEIIKDIIAAEVAGIDVNFIDGIICPGFVNAHCHLELSYLKNIIPQKCGMIPFLEQVIKTPHPPTEIIQDAITKAEASMIANGIIAVGDICNTGNTIAQKQLGNIYYKNFIEISGFVPQTAAQRFEQGSNVVKAFEAANLQATIVPHAPYSVSKDLLQLIANNNKHISLHYLESSEEKVFIENGTGNFNDLFKAIGVDISFYTGYNNIENYQIQFENFNEILLVHNVFVNETIVNHLQTLNTALHYCICPNANLYIGNPLPDIDFLAMQNINICIGTDSLASNTSLDILSEIKAIQQHFPKNPLETLLQWATSNGAKALGIADYYGSFEVGKCGKYVVIKN